jgi:ribosomal protein L32
MADLNANEDIIFKSTNTLFNISKDLKDIAPKISDALLFLSDRLLSKLETPGVEESLSSKEMEKTMSAAQMAHLETCPDCGGYKPEANVCTDEHCPDCGGIKQPVACTDENCPDCGGIKPEAVKTPVYKLSTETSIQEIIENGDPTKGCRGHVNLAELGSSSNECRGHSNDGSGGDPSKGCGGHSVSTGVAMDPNDPSTMCHGHSGDGPSNPVQQTKPLEETHHSPKIKNEVQSLIDEMRKGLK